MSYGAPGRPVWGAAPCSAARRIRSETDLAIIVTPHLVQPARPGDVLKSPLDNTVVGNDADVFLHGRPELTPRQVREVNPWLENGKPVGHILDLPKGAS